MVTDDMPVSCGNLSAVLENVGGGVLLYSNSIGSESGSLSRDADGFDVLLVTYVANLLSNRSSTRVCYAAGPGEQVNVENYSGDIAKITVSGTSFSVDGDSGVARVTSIIGMRFS